MNTNLHLARICDLQDPAADLRDATALYHLLNGVETMIRNLVTAGLHTRAEAERATRVFRPRGPIETIWENRRKHRRDNTLRMNRVYDQGGLWTPAAIALANTPDRGKGMLRFEHVVPAQVLVTGMHDIIASTDLTEQEQISTIIHLLRTLPHHVTLTRDEDKSLFSRDMKPGAHGQSSPHRAWLAPPHGPHTH